MQESTDLILILQPTTAGTDQPDHTFWDKRMKACNQLIHQARKEDCPQYTTKEFPVGTAEPLLLLHVGIDIFKKPLVSLLASVIYLTNLLASGEKKDDKVMDLHYTKMQEMMYISGKTL